jgi:hypothetical protein
MREQTAQQPPMKRRASAVPANSHHASFSGGIDPEDQPYQSEDFEVGSEYLYTQRLPTSTRRYYDTRGNQIIQRGNQRIVIHEEPPRYRRPRRFHWLFWVGVVMFIAIGGTWVVNTIGAWWLNEQNNFNYGMPRTYQTDAVVGHSDNSVHPSHFIALNLNGHIEVIEIPGGDPSKERVYVGPTIFSANPELVPVTVSFEDVNGDGKPDMLLHIQGQTIPFLNNGSQFQTSK